MEQPVPSRAATHPGEPRLWHGALALALGGLAAAVIGTIAARYGGVPERYMATVALVAGASVVAGIAIAWIVRVRDMSRLSIAAVAMVSVWLAATATFTLAAYVRFRADLLLWAESEFVHDLLKIRVGYPLYTTQLNNESFIYAPGAQLITYAIARPFGLEGSIPFLRGVQSGFLVLAAIVAFVACRNLLRMTSTGAGQVSRLWGFVWVPVFFLAATNPLTNTFTYGLHNDALACLLSVLGFDRLVRVGRNPSRANLLTLACIPVLGFAVKQSLAIWAILGTGYLLFFVPARSFKRAFVFAVGAFGGILALVGLGLLIWGEPFWYWVFVVPGTRGVSVMRSAQHVLDAWPYFVAGLVGGGLVLRHVAPGQMRAVFGLWLSWVLFMATEAYTSGIGWTLHHMGPGSVIAVIWLLLGVALWWNRTDPAMTRPWPALPRYAVQAAVLLLFFNGLALVRLPISAISDDHERYLKAIESEFQGADTARTLLDEGTWVYLPSRIVQKDRGVVIGDRGYAMSGDFSGMIQRLDQKYYSKLLIRSLHEPHFYYDHEIWPRSSGIRAAILKNYVELRQIPAVKGSTKYGFGIVSILVPRAPDSTPARPPGSP